MKCCTDMWKVQDSRYMIIKISLHRSNSYLSTTELCQLKAI
ncbi:unnamed protein product [Amoebophrya sp. A25]|nr:unnamed protein product [Amoebophrya sp. A25]|eukprot:GSA25T00028066001.1